MGLCASSNSAESPEKKPPKPSVAYDESGAAPDQIKADSTIFAALQAKRRGDIFVQSFQPDEKFDLRVIAKPAEVTALIQQALKKNILFAELTDDQMHQVIDSMEAENVGSKFELIKQGDQGDNFYVVEKGGFEVLVEGRHVAEYTEGGSFGELALLYNCPRAATVRSVMESKVWVLKRDTYRHIVVGSQQRIHDEISAALKSVPLLSALSEDQINKICDAVALVQFHSKDVIIRKGDEGNIFYIVKKGKVKCTKAGQQTAELHLGVGDYFGERALMTNEVRAANVIAVAETECMVLDRESFNSLLGPLSELLDHNLGMRVLKSVPLLAKLSERERESILPSFVSVEFKGGEHIIRQDEDGDTFYVVREGVVEVTKTVEGAEEPAKVATLGTGDYFGEGALLKNDKRGANLVAKGPVKCFELSRKDFEAHLGKLKDIMDRALDTREEVTESVVKKQRRQVESNIKFEDLKQIRTLGTGTFGRVKLVQHSQLKETYALKILQKAQVVAYRQQTNVINEKRIMMEADHPFILKLFTTFKDRDCLYMLLELVQGGELFTLLHIRGGKLDKGNDAKFYSACVLDALQYLHHRTVVYRDLKPENLLIDTAGYIKVVDFGFAKKVTDKTFTLCGTPEYLSPELVLGKGHNKGVDYWALGILLFEMMTGSSPFADHQNSDHMVICKNIVRAKLEFPKKFADKPKDLVTKLLTRDAHLRLGCLKGGADDIKSHVYYKGFDFKALLRGKVKAPWIPSVSDPLDCSNFEPYDEEDNSIEPYRDPNSKWCAEF